MADQTERMSVEECRKVIHDYRDNVDKNEVMLCVAAQDLLYYMIHIHEEADHCLATRPNSGEWRDSMRNIHGWSGEVKELPRPQKDFPYGPDGGMYSTRWEWEDAWRRHRGEKELGPRDV